MDDIGLIILPWTSGKAKLNIQSCSLQAFDNKQAVIPEMREAHMWASHASLLLPESIFQTLAQGLESTWRPQALWTEKWRPELSAKWLWFREGRAQSSREGSPKVCMVFVCPWLTQSSRRTGPETTAMGGQHRADASVQRCWGHWNLVPVRLDWQAVAWESGPLLGVSIVSGDKAKWKQPCNWPTTAQSLS